MTEEKDEMQTKYVLKTGHMQLIDLPEAKTFKRKYGGIRVFYCGMPNKETFSVARGYGKDCYAAMVNVYYPKNTESVQLHRLNADGAKVTPFFDVHKVTPEELILLYPSKNKE